MINKIVNGSILNNYGEPIPNCKVEVYLKKIRNNLLLGTTYADQCGKYNLQYSIDESQSNSNPCSQENAIPVANIFVRAYICTSSTLADTGFDMFCQSASDCSSFIESAVVYNAVDEQTIDLIEGGSIIQQPQYDRYTLEIRRLIYNMNITDLEVTPDNNDIEYVANMLGLTEKEVLFIIMCHRIEANPDINTLSLVSSLNGYVVYSFLELDRISGLNDLINPLYTDFTNINEVLKEIVKKIIGLDETTQKNTLLQAIEDNLIGEIADDLMQGIIDYLNSLRVDSVNNSPTVEGGTTTGDLLSIAGLPTEAATGFLDAFTSNGSDLEQALQQLKANDPQTFTDEVVNTIQYTFALEQLAVGHGPTISSLLSQVSSNQVPVIADFAGRTASQWEDEIHALISGGEPGYPDDILGDTEEERIANYAQALEDIFTSTYPMAAAAHAMAAAAPEAEPARAFIAANAPIGTGDYPMGTLNIDGLVDSSQISVQSKQFRGSQVPQKTIEDAKKCQRILRITNDKTLSGILYKKDLSAQKIYLMGKGNFIKMMVDLGVNKKVATDAFANATMIYFNLLSEFGRLNSFTNNLVPSAVGPVKPTKKQEAKLPEYPSLSALMGRTKPLKNMFRSSDYNTLFGSTSYCECEQCKSVHGASAYLVDMLQFLSYRNMTKDNSSPISARDLLFNRRSDIGNIMLTCENTNTPMPYIDLVNEILEGSISKKQVKNQTTKTEVELKAMPEYIDDEVYTILANTIAVKDLPFNLYNEEAREYLKAININFEDIIEIFGKESENKDYLIALESLKFNYIEGKFIINPKLISTQDKEVLEAKAIKIIDILNTTGLTYNQLQDALATVYINSGSPNIINSDSCDISSMQFDKVYDSIAYNLPVFIRLFKATGWRMCDIDLAIQSPKLGNGIVDSNFIVQIKLINDLRAKLGLTIEQIIIFYRTLNVTTQYKEDNENIETLYEKLFLNKSILNNSKVDPAFKNITKTEKLLDHKATILGALCLSESEFTTLINSLGNVLDNNGTDLLLTYKNLNFLTRYTFLARGLNIAISELIKAVGLIYKSQTFDIFQSPKITCDFIEKYENIKKYNFDVRTINYLLNETTGEDSLISKDDIVKQFITNLRNHLSATNIDQQANVIIEQFGTEFKLQIPTSTYILSEMLYNDSNILSSLSSDLNRLVEKNEENQYVYVVNRENFYVIFEAYYLIHKISLLINKLKIETDEFRFIDNMGGDLNLLDFKYLGLNIVNYGQWLNLVKLYELKKLYPKHDEISIFTVLHSSLTDTDIATFNKVLVDLTYWDLNILVKLQKQDDIFYPVNNNIEAIFKYNTQINLLNQIGAKADDVFDYAQIDIYTGENIDKAIEVANSIIQTVKSKFSNDNWLNISANIQDKIRVKKRDALVAYLINKGSRFSTSNDIYEYYLIDNQMSPCQLTTRILQANAAIQLFAQRCIMNLEDYRILESDTDWNQWNSWMKNYRVWEANRLIFLYPENWLEPELRDNKTPFFKELEDKLNQNEITNDYVEDLFIEYLEKVEEVANLEICGFYKQQDNGVQRVHIVGRTNEDPRTYYYRTQEVIDESIVWSPWEKINLNISSDEVLIFVLNKRLHLFWLDIEERAYAKQDLPVVNTSQTTNVTGTHPKKYWNIKLNWSVYKSNNWTTAKTYPNDLIMIDSEIANRDYSAIHLRANIRDDYFAEICIYHNFSGKYGTKLYSINFNGKVASCIRYNCYFTIDVTSEIKDCIGKDYTLPINRGINGLKYPPQDMIFKYNYLVKSASDNSTLRIRTDFESDKGNILNYRPCNVIMPTNANYTQSNGPFIYQDTDRTYFIDLEYSMYFEQVKYQETCWIFSKCDKIKNVQKFNYLTWSFYPLYHPYINVFSQELIKKGLKGILNRNIQLNPNSYNEVSTDLFDFNRTYSPNTSTVKVVYGDLSYDDSNTEIVDFSDSGSYSLYNWEIFFHIPMLIANKLNQNQRFGEAQKWYHYVFDPTSLSTDTIPNKYWITKPFYKTTSIDYQEEEINKLMSSKFNSRVKDAINAWRRDPFDPHLIARTRTVAYQKNVVMKYIDNLIDWGDQLFKMDTFESINQATQLYIIAAKILGDRPVKLSAKDTDIKSYNDIKGNLDDFSNGIAENALQINTNQSTLNELDIYNNNPVINLNSLYFCITPNDNLLRYWDTVADRLYKIRNCMNIEGILQQLNLFEPPIEPGILVKATASGVDIDTILDDTSSVNVPYYKFKVLVKKATELCNHIQKLGKSLLKVLEAKDADAIANIASTTSDDILDLLITMKQQEVEASQCDIDSLNDSKATIKIRSDYYSSLEKIIAEESSQRALIGAAILSQYSATVFDMLSAIAYIVPDFKLGVSGFGGSPEAGAETGGTGAGDALGAVSSFFSNYASALGMQADLAGLQADTARNYKEWQYEITSAASDMKSMDNQIKAANIRLDIAKADLKSQIFQKRDIGILADYYNNKYTNEELYNWLISQVSTVYFKAYKLAYNVAKKAEISYNYELGKTESFIKVGYWDSLKKGLLAGEKLYQDIKTMEISYMDENARQYELTKHISLNKHNPIALEFLKQTGYCYIHLPELLFDMDYHDHYFRRIKSVSLSIKCDKDPLTTLSCTLKLSNSKYRKNDKLNNSKYMEQLSNESRFNTGIRPPISSIATSSGEFDNGLFELNFNDERYLPFEGAGAISDWVIQLNSDYKQFDFNTITDVIIHMDYTAKGSTDNDFRIAARNEVKEAINSNIKSILSFNKPIRATVPDDTPSGLYKAFSLKSLFNSFAEPTTKVINDITMPLDKIDFGMFDYYEDVKVNSIQYFVLMKNTFMLSGNGLKVFSNITDKQPQINEYNENSYVNLQTFKYKLDVPFDDTQTSTILYNSQVLNKDISTNSQDISLTVSLLNSDGVKITTNDIDDLIIILNYE